MTYATKSATETASIPKKNYFPYKPASRAYKNPCTSAFAILAPTSIVLLSNSILYFEITSLNSPMLSNFCKHA